MVRLPIPGSDDGSWGTLLNDYLSVEHNADGSLKQSGAITQAGQQAQQALNAVPTGGTTGQVLTKASNSDRDTQWSSTSSTVSSVNGQSGAVVLDADDVSDTSTTNKYVTAADKTKLSGIEAGADVTDAANVAAAGAMMTNNALGYVDVTTGNEARPANARVIWIGGTTQPVNMQNLDVWLKAV